MARPIWRLARFLLALGSLSCADNGGTPGGDLAAGGELVPMGGSGTTAIGGSAAATGAGSGGRGSQGGTPAAGGGGAGTTGVGGASGGDGGGTGTGGLDNTAGATGNVGGGATDSAGEGGAGGAGPAGDVICPPGPYEQNPLPDDGASATAVCNGLMFGEGAVWLRSRGSLFFSDFAESDAVSNFNGTIVEYVPGGSCTPFIQNAGTNGLAISSDGNLLGARHLDQTITAFDLQSGQSSVVVGDYQGSHFGSPNDLAVRSDGNLYFTDPGFQRGNRPEELAPALYWRDVPGNVTLVEQLAGPNGVSLAPDETLLYVAHTGVGQIRVYDLDAGGAPSNPRPFITESSSDGMVVDCAGNLYLTTGGGVSIYSSSGDLIASLPATGATNVAFGGSDRKTLFITTANALLTATLNIPGFPY